jgi:glycosyltransferase involved in cell wall biosynthesis
MATTAGGSSLRVGFNARFLAVPDLRGWNRYTVNLLAELPAAGVEPVLYSDRPLHAGHLARFPEGSYAVRVAEIRPYLRWEQVWLPRACGRDQVDLLHAPANFGLPWSSPCPRVLTLHDAIDHVYTAPRARLWDVWGPRALRGRLAQWSSRIRADRVITVSAHAGADLVGCLGIPAGKVRVIHEAADPAMLRPVSDLERARVAARHGLERPYVFYVGGWEQRKNVPFLVRAFAASNLGADGVDLVLAGGRDDERAALLALAGSLGIGDRIRLIGWVGDDDLPALYAGALCFVYPSEYEGFGLQLCEAMAVGCPVLASAATSLPEVVGAGGETFDLGSTGTLASLLRRVASEPAFRAELACRALLRSADFSWRRTAEATVAVYRELVPQTQRGSTCASAARS